MNENNLDDLVSEHREGVRLSDDQLGKNRARLLARVAAGATIAASTTTSTAVAATTSHVSTTLAVKLIIGVLVAGGAGTAYYVTRSHAPVATLPAVVQETPAAAPAPEPSAADLVPAPAAEPEAVDTVSPTARAPKPSASNSSSLAAEIQLMHDVESALSSGQPARALQLLDDAAKSGHGGRYAGTMGEERAAARVVTLCRLGRADEARAEAARFVKDRPRSPLVERVRSTCAKGSDAR